MNFPITPPVIVLVGPTAVGKTALSLQIASIFDCEIVSMDSMQVYRYMDIGTAKATMEERKAVPHHILDIVDPDENYDANRYVADALSAIQEIHGREKIPLLTGGTGLYLRSLVDGIFQGAGEFPEIREQLKHELQTKGPLKLHEELTLYDCISATRIHPNDTQRLLRALEIYRGSGMPWSEHIQSQKREGEQRFSNMISIGLSREREILYTRINKRTSLMLREGLRDEVERLIDRGYNRDLKSMQSIGYRHMIEHLFDMVSIGETEKLLARDTRRYAKRQLTWFSKMKLKWFSPDEQGEIADFIHSKLNA